MISLLLLPVLLLGQPTTLPAGQMQMNARPAAAPAGYLSRAALESLALTTLIPTPPAADSAANKLELSTVLALQQGLTPERREVILKENKAWDGFSLAPALGVPNFTAANCPKTAAVFRKLNGDIVQGQNIPRLHFKRPRPFAVDPRIEALAAMDAREPGYPSGHAIRASLIAELLAGAFPERRQALADAVQLTLLGRAQLGVHYPSDLQAGATVGLALHRALMADDTFRKEWQAAEAEMRDVAKSTFESGTK